MKAIIGIIFSFGFLLSISQGVDGGPTVFNLIGISLLCVSAFLGHKFKGRSGDDV